jgi:hypothetical protein
MGSVPWIICGISVASLCCVWNLERVANIHNLFHKDGVLFQPYLQFDNEVACRTQPFVPY